MNVQNLAAIGRVTCLIGAPVLAAGGQSPLCVSGVYPHLAVFNSQVLNGETYGSGGECGIGAVVPWADRLWLLTYSPHCPTGSTDKLYAIDADLRHEIRPESIGGTPAGRLIHRESQQLFIGPYAIDARGQVRAIPYSAMPGRNTAVARHLTDPANRVYVFDMEGRIYEVDVHRLSVKLLFSKPVPGWHGKGGYTGQGRYVIANNGEGAVAGHSYDDLRAGGPAQDPEDMGVLAEWDGASWRILERRQFTEVTGPGGILGAPSDDSPLWAVGWDRRSVILKLCDAGQWHTFRLPKGSHTYDGRGGWYTEWPRIREIAPDRLMLDMHALFWDFPAGFRAGQTAGLRPIATHHRYIPDFCHWNGRLVLASDDTSIMNNPMAGQSQSNLWFGTVAQLAEWGPRAGWGGPWLQDTVKAGQPSDPFAVGGFPRRCLHLARGRGLDGSADAADGERCTGGQFHLQEVPPSLAGLPRVTIARGDFHKPAPGYTFTINRPAVVYLAVDERPQAVLGDGWEKTDLRLRWDGYGDLVYRRRFPAGTVVVPGHPQPHKPAAYGVPHLCFVSPDDGSLAGFEISGLPADLGGRVVTPAAADQAPAEADARVTVEVDRDGSGHWEAWRNVALPAGGYAYHILPSDLPAEWLRVVADREARLTAYLHLGDEARATGPDAALFAALARPDDAGCAGAWIRPGSHNRNLQVLARVPAADGSVAETYLEVDENLRFGTPVTDRADEVREVAAVTPPAWSVDAASVVVSDRGLRYRLPKGEAPYDRPFASGWPRALRECESERLLLNAHGTFYEVPLEAGVARLKPVATHGRQILDYCTWRGLLVLAGVQAEAPTDGHCFRAAGPRGFGLWFGAIDDLWKLGKPVGQGGPWRDTAVVAGQPSDPYLMTNYDRKRVELSHTATTPVTFTLEVDVDHAGWRVYQAISVPVGQTLTHVFPEGYGAHWARLRADAACRATAWFVYE